MCVGVFTLVGRVTLAFGAGGCGRADVNNGILVIVATKIDGSTLHWPLCNAVAFKNLQRVAALQISQKIVRNGVYTITIFRATSYHCKSTSVTPPYAAKPCSTCLAHKYFVHDFLFDINLDKLRQNTGLFMPPLLFS